MAKLTIGLGLCGIAALAAVAFAAENSRQFVIDGNVVSTDVLQQNGRYWVPLDQVGKYFGYFVSVNASQANLTKIPAPPSPNQGNQKGQGQNEMAPGGSGGGGSAPSGSQSGGSQSFVSGTGSQPQDPSQDQSQNKSAAQISVNLGDAASVDGTDYKVTAIRDVGAEYKETYDQHASQLHPKYKTDTLLVVDIEETNRGPKPVQALIPDSSAINVFDAKKVGYGANYMDVRQSTDTVKKANNLGLDLPDENEVNIMLGPGGTLKFAVIASVPMNDPIDSVVMNVSGNGTNDSPTGAVVTVNRPN